MHRKVVLHVVVGGATDFRPRAPFYPEVNLTTDLQAVTAIDELISTEIWGGWVADLFDELQKRSKETLHLIVPILFTPLPEHTEHPTPKSFCGLRPNLTSARSNLIKHGVNEIETGCLLIQENVVQECFVKHQGSLSWQEKLETQAFREVWCLIPPDQQVTLEYPLKPLPFFDPLETPVHEWIEKVLATCHFMP